MGKIRTTVCVYTSACAAHVLYDINRTEKKKPLHSFIPLDRKIFKKLRKCQVQEKLWSNTSFSTIARVSTGTNNLCK